MGPSILKGSLRQYPYLGGDKDTELEATKLFLRSVGGGGKVLNKSQEQFLKSQQSAWLQQDKAQISSESTFLAGRGKGLEDVDHRR